MKFLLMFSVLALLILALCSCSDGKWDQIRKESAQITLPDILISTENGAEIADREHYIAMTLSVKGCEKEEYNTVNVPGFVRGRGNSTWDFCDKKSYRLKLDLEINLLGAGDGGDKDWVLISNAREKSMMRNYAVFLLAKKMGMQAVTDCLFANLYINGEYMGMYLLCESVEFGENRLDIDDEGTGVDIGYLLELDSRAVGESKHSYEYFYVNDWSVPFAVKSKISGGEQNAFIKRFMEDTDNALMTGQKERIEEFLDINSAVDMYIIEEFSKDRDVGFASLFLYKEPGEKLHFGFPWDFDLALGNDSGEDRLDEKDSPKLNYKGTSGIVAGVLNRWFAALTGEQWFMELVAERFSGLSEDFEALFEEVARVGFSMSDEAERNYDKWKIMGKRQLFEPFEVVRIRTYNGQVNYLLSWMEKRHAWLEEYLSRYKVA